LGINLVSNPKWIVLSMLTIGISKNGSSFTQILPKIWQMFWKTVIFGSNCQIWHHLATLLAETDTPFNKVMDA